MLEGMLGKALFFRDNFKSNLIYSFEPSPIAFSVLTKLRISDFVPINCAIGDRDGTQNFFLSKISETSTFILPNSDSKWERRKKFILGMDQSEMYSPSVVPVIKLDSFLVQNKISEVEWLKIDVEGYEMQVLAGAKLSLQRKIFKFVQVEVHSSDMRPMLGTLIEEILFGSGYNCIAKLRHPFGNFHELVFSKFI